MLYLLSLLLVAKLQAILTCMDFVLIEGDKTVLHVTTKNGTQSMGAE